MIRSAVFPEKTNPCFLEALGSMRFLLVRGCQRLGQPVETPFPPAPPGRVPFLIPGCRRSSAALFSKRLSEARAAIEGSRPDFVKAIFFQREAKPFKHRQLFFQFHH